MGLKEPEIFRDAIGQSIKMRLMNFALEKHKDYDLSKIEKSINETQKIVEITREAISEALKAESELLFFKQSFGEEIPILFISGILHSIDVVAGKSIMDNL